MICVNDNMTYLDIYITYKFQYLMNTQLMVDRIINHGKI